MRKGYIVTPAFNEEEGIQTFLGDLSRVLQKYGETNLGYSFVVLIVDDGSRDQTSEKVMEFARSQNYAHVRFDLIRFIKNFGHQAALVAGIRKAAGDSDFVITMDADGEHPVELVPELIESWKKSNTIIHTKRKPSEKLSAFKRMTSRMYYSLISFGSGIRIRQGMADFKLWDSHVLRQTADFLPNCGSTRVFAMWLSPNSPVIEFEQKVIEGRVSRFSFGKMFNLGLGGLIRYSELPLRFAMLFGVAVLILSFLLTAHSVWAYFQGQTIPGWASLMAIVGFFGGVNAMLLGLLSEYLLQLSFRTNFPRYVSFTHQRPDEWAPTTSGHPIS